MCFRLFPFVTLTLSRAACWTDLDDVSVSNNRLAVLWLTLCLRLLPLSHSLLCLLVLERASKASTGYYRCCALKALTRGLPCATRGLTCATRGLHLCNVPRHVPHSDVVRFRNCGCTRHLAAVRLASVIFKCHRMGVCVKQLPRRRGTSATLKRQRSGVGRQQNLG
jgi:hypothetical protein